MALIKGSVSTKQIELASIPSASEGAVLAQVDGKKMQIKWKRDKNGITLETENGFFGYDVIAQKNDDGQFTYRLGLRGSDSFSSDLVFLKEGETLAADSTKSKKGAKVKAQMPGKIVRVLVAEGTAVTKGQSILVMEAMKMENEIKAAANGKVKNLKVTVGQNVETGTLLLEIES